MWHVAFAKRMSLLQKTLAFILLLLLFSLLIVYGAQNGDSLFGKKGEFCEGDNCDQQGINLEDIDAPRKVVTPVRVGSVGDVNKPNTQKSQTPEESENKSSSKTDSAYKNNSPTEQEELDVIITFTNAQNNQNLQKKFTLTVSSLLQHSSVPLKIHIIGEDKSQAIANKILAESAEGSKGVYRTVKLDVDKLAKQLDEMVKPMQKHFSYKPGAYYNHALFFLSIAMHRVMPKSMKRVIMLDADLKFMADVKELYDRFEMFTEDQVIGIGRDLQPVYRHAFWQYRRDNPGTRVGNPPPDGLTGFNSGVLLLNLEAMRKSKLYNSLIAGEKVAELTEEFHFKGHLGDQDFFTLVNMKYEKLFHVLPCTWNRQLCTWWRNHGYEDVFDQYFTCEGDIKIYHGNCNTPIP